MLVVFAEPTGAAQPCEGSFHDPATRQQLEAMDRFVVFDDLQPSAAARPQAAHPLHECAGIATVGPDASQPAEASPQGGEQQSGAIAVLHVGRVYADQQNQSQGIDQKVSLSSCHLLASIVSTNSPLLSCSHTLCVENRSSRGFFLPAWRRTASRRASLSRAHTPCFFQWAKWCHTSFHGGRSFGSIRHAQPHGAVTPARTQPAARLRGVCQRSDRIDQRTTNQPFFYYIPFDGPHDPHIVPEGFPINYNPAKIPLPPNFLPQQPWDNGWM
jgi:hypothetical protein